MNAPPAEPDATHRMIDPRVLDPRGDVVDYLAMNDAEVTQVVRVLAAMRRWREAEEQMSLHSRNHMKLNETDMKALRFLVAAKNEGRTVTPGALSEHLHISSASTTKLLDRLTAAGHIERAPHPSDRRAVVVTIMQSTHEQVRDTVGVRQARRFRVAAALSPQEREVVIRFVNALADTAVDQPTS